MEKISEIVKGIRKETGMTQLEFAILIGATRGSVAKYETGLTTPPGNVMLKILNLKGETNARRKN